MDQGKEENVEEILIERGRVLFVEQDIVFYVRDEVLERFKNVVSIAVLKQILRFKRNGGMKEGGV